MGKGKLKGGRRKGVPFENEIAGDLSEWMSWGESRDWFRRTEASGGRATARPSDDPLYWEYGDITFRNERGKPLAERLLIECKRGHKEHINFVCLVDSWGSKRLKKRWVLDWWDKAWQEANAANRRFPVIIFKRDFMDKAIIVPRMMIGMLELYCGPYTTGYYLELRSGWPDGGHSAVKDFTVLPFYEFLEWCSPEDLVQGIPTKNSIQV